MSLSRWIENSLLIMVNVIFLTISYLSFSKVFRCLRCAGVLKFCLLLFSLFYLKKCHDSYLNLLKKFSAFSAIHFKELDFDGIGIFLLRTKAFCFHISTKWNESVLIKSVMKYFLRARCKIPRWVLNKNVEETIRYKTNKTKKVISCLHFHQTCNMWDV